MDDFCENYVYWYVWIVGFEICNLKKKDFDGVKFYKKFFFLNVIVYK